MSTETDTGGQAVVEGDAIIIRVPIDALQDILDGSSPSYGMAERYTVTNNAMFAAEICHAINDEDERGETPFHKMFDAAMDTAISNGCEGIDHRAARNAGGRDAG